MTTYDLVGIGNAVVDVITRADDHFLEMMGIEKGIMQLVELDRSEVLFGAMAERTEAPGGSVANTIAGAGALGLKTAFIGRVRDDALGQSYAEAMAASGTDFVNPPVKGGALPTSRSMIFVAPEGERSMNTYLGISAEVGPDDIPPGVVERAKILFLEGYLFDKEHGKAAFRRAADLAHEGGGLAGIAISDPFCVERHRDDFLELIRDRMDYVIGNEAEICSLFQTDDVEAALSQVAALSDLVVCTRSGNGITILNKGSRTDVAVEKVTPVDATGAGDQFAAGFLYGVATGRDMATAGRMGAIAAAEVISHIGPRPERSVAELFRAEGLID